MRGQSFQHRVLFREGGHTYKNQDSHTDSGRGLPAPESLGKMEFSVPRATCHVEAQSRVNHAEKLPQAIV